MTARYKLYGGGGSPYSMKMRAVLRYRRLPFDWVLISPDLRAELNHEGPPVIPILRLPEDGSLLVDSTPLCYLLEERHKERSIIPADPAIAFLSDLLEDMGDEWCTKMMFLYRWRREVDQNYSARQIISDNSPGTRGADLDRAAEGIKARQVTRMALVGCTEANAPVIEQGYHELLSILDSFVTRDEFLFGSRPSLGDFGIFGQLKVLARDHTPMLIMRNEFPSVYDWVRRLDDASGIEGNWHSMDDLRPAVGELLTLAGNYYLPFLQANEEAYSQGNQQLEVELGGHQYTQAPFKYQVKCYDRLRKKYAALDPTDSSRIEELLGDTHCLEYLR
jgi:glutathione S-transferase